MPPSTKLYSSGIGLRLNTDEAVLEVEPPDELLAKSLLILKCTRHSGPRVVRRSALSVTADFVPKLTATREPAG